jgi:WD40 repeat protein
MGISGAFVASTALLLACYYVYMGPFARFPPDLEARTPGTVIGLGASPHEIVATCDCQGHVTLIEIPSGNVVDIDLHGKRMPLGVSVSPDGSTVTLNGGDCFQAWDLTRRTPKRWFWVDTGRWEVNVFWDNSGKYVYVGNATKITQVQRVELATGASEVVFKPDRLSTKLNANEAFQLLLASVSPDGESLVIGTWARAFVWDIPTQTERFSCPIGCETTCTCAAVRPDGRQLATGGDCLAIWDFRSGRPVTRLAFPKRPGKDLVGIYGLAYSPGSEFLVASLAFAVNFPSYIAVWRTSDYSLVTSFQCERSLINAMVFVPGTNKLVTGGSDHKVRIWDLDRLR